MQMQTMYVQCAVCTCSPTSHSLHLYCMYIVCKYISYHLVQWLLPCQILVYLPINSFVLKMLDMTAISLVSISFQNYSIRGWKSIFDNVRWHCFIQKLQQLCRASVNQLKFQLKNDNAENTIHACEADEMTVKLTQMPTKCHTHCATHTRQMIDFGYNFHSNELTSNHNHTMCDDR